MRPLCAPLLLAALAPGAFAQPKSAPPPADSAIITEGSVATVIIVNAGPTEMDDLADVRLEGSISDLLPRLVAP